MPATLKWSDDATARFLRQVLKKWPQQPEVKEIPHWTLHMDIISYCPHCPQYHVSLNFSAKLVLGKQSIILNSFLIMLYLDVLPQGPVVPGLSTLPTCSTQRLAWTKLTNSSFFLFILLSSFASLSKCLRKGSINRQRVFEVYEQGQEGGGWEEEKQKKERRREGNLDSDKYDKV